MLIEREEEIQELRQAYDSEESKFIAIFGRRRIGKTYIHHYSNSPNHI